MANVLTGGIFSFGGFLIFFPHKNPVGLVLFGGLQNMRMFHGPAGFWPNIYFGTQNPLSVVSATTFETEF